MNISGPNILRGNTLDPQLTYQSIRQLYVELERLKQNATIATKPTAPLHGSGPVTSVEQIKTMLQAADEHPLNVQSLLGRLAEPQIPYAPIVSTLPPLGDPQSQNGSLVQLQTAPNTYVQYEFDGRPGGMNTWVISPTPVVIPPVTYTLLDHDITLVTVNANTTANQTLMTYTFAAGQLNTAGKTVRVTCYGDLDEDTGPNIQFTLALVNGASISGMAIWQPNTPGATKTNLPWMMRAEMVTHATGAGGDMEVHGLVQVDPAKIAGTIGSPILDHNTSGPNPVDLTLAQTLKIFIGFSTGSVANVGRQRMMLIELLN